MECSFAFQFILLCDLLRFQYSVCLYFCENACIGPLKNSKGCLPEDLHARENGLNQAEQFIFHPQQNLLSCEKRAQMQPTLVTYVRGYLCGIAGLEVFQYWKRNLYAIRASSTAVHDCTPFWGPLSWYSWVIVHNLNPLVFEPELMWPNMQHTVHYGIMFAVAVMRFYSRVAQPCSWRSTFL